MLSIKGEDSLSSQPRRHSKHKLNDQEQADLLYNVMHLKYIVAQPSNSREIRVGKMKNNDCTYEPNKLYRLLEGLPEGNSNTATKVLYPKH